ncbi:GNAT family N-acetyltransferase [Parenemella sanctibonifatiensis]|uniref:GNAT family N-acetyltransferase n=1 Tax=Parenemella sanctibonifatiensis TaxID=2016505 RepID=A0A255EF83_9ACTN|nr:GNAT family N-acetyltransferase [Parenemella sanctibonifatiensis]OYN88245.1 GNAT family N-acetyltransferase [Parenemella sanctibonifatiensis]
MSAPSQTGTVRILNNDDLRDVIRVLLQQPVDSVFVASRIRRAGLEEFQLGAQIWGYEEDGQLLSLCHAGANLVPVEASNAALAAYVERCGPQRRCSSITGPAEVALKFHQMLIDRWGGSWLNPREIRAHQPVMTIEEDPHIEGDPRVRRMGNEDLAAYYPAAVAMYTEEVGTSPVTPDNADSYKFYVRNLIATGSAFGIVDNGATVFKADLGSATAAVCQVQGVWIDPDHRGQGLAAPAMASVVRMAREQIPVVSLYVNDFNTPARKTYQRVGFQETGEFATILY